MSPHNMWIEGIGNEVVFALGVFVTMFVPMFLMMMQRGTFNQRIHPDSVSNVQETREEVNQHRHQHNGQEASTTAGRQDSPQHSHPGRLRPIRENHGQHDCPICLATAEYAIQTNCGHIFCGLCIVTYWQHGSWLGAVTCPVCRQTVTLLLINFTHNEHNSSSVEKQQIVDSIYQYNRRFSGEPRPVMDYLRDLPTLLRHCFRELFTAGGLVMMFRLRILVLFIFAILYFLSPLDIIPEAVFGIFGFLDDLFILLLLGIYVSLIYRNVVAQRGNH